MLTNRHKDNLRRDAKPNRDDARSDAGGDEELFASLVNVADRVTLTVDGRDNGTADQRERDLAAVSVAGERETDAIGDGRENIGIVRNGDD